MSVLASMPDRLTWRFPAREHLRRSQDFQDLRHDGRVVRHPALYLSFKPNGLEYNRYGWIVGRQISGAVARNRLRRQLREIVRLRRHRLVTGYDIVLIARPAVSGKPYTDLARIVDGLLERASLLHDIGATE